MNMKLYTIGHSNHSQEEFLDLLVTHGIDVVIDVRSIPASNHHPQFNQDAISGFLSKHHIDYLFFGKELGARRMDCINTNGQVDFERAAHTSLFRQGIDKTLQLLSNKKVTLMCSEADPLACHRFALVSRVFHNNGVEIFHILKDASIVSQQTLEQQMVSHYLHARKPLLPEVDQLFGTYTFEQQMADAYRLKNKEIGFQLKQEDNFD